MTEFWQTPPTFIDGQVISASAHLDALRNNAEYLLGLYEAHRPVQTVYAIVNGDGHFGRWGGSDNWHRLYTGFVKKTFDTLYYSFTVTPDAVRDLKIRITWHDVNDEDEDVTQGTGQQTVSGSIDVSGVTDTYYRVTVDLQSLDGATPDSTLVDHDVLIDYIYEADAESYTSLNAFTTGTTPTVANWNELSTAATELHTALSGPRAVMTGGTDQQREYDDETTYVVYRGTMVYLHRYLYYDIRMHPADKDGTLSAKVYVNDSLVDTFTVDEDDRWWTPDSSNPDHADAEREFIPKRGTIDLNAEGLTIGNRYEVRVDAYLNLDSHSDDGYAKVEVEFLYQQQPSTPTFSGWTTVADADQGDTVTGTTASIKGIRDNLTALQGEVTHRNYPAVRWRPNYGFPGQWMTRFHKWLHYRIDPSSSQEESEIAPMLCYWKPVEGWQEVTLPWEAHVWQTLDLDSVDSLYPGTRYTVKDTNYALEASSYA